MGTLRVIIAEDDGTARGAVAEYVRRLGPAVYEATDGEEAARIIAAQGGVDVIVTDHHMPGWDGLRLLDHCRAQGLHAAVVFISADEPIEDPDVLKLGARCAVMMRKPFHLDDLGAALAAVFAGEHPRGCLHAD